MKKYLILILAIIASINISAQSFSPLISNYESGDEPFVITISNSLGTGQTFTLPLVSGGTYDFTADWGDGTSSEITAYDDPDITHTYSGDAYTISMTGTLTAWAFNYSGDKDKLTGITSFGNVGLTDLGNGFYGCENASGAIPDIPDGIYMLYQTFRNTGFTSVNLDGITDINFASFRESNLNSVTIPITVTDINLQAFYMSSFNGGLYIYVADLFPNGSFRSITGVTKLYLYNTNITNIGAYAFTGTVVSGDVYIYTAIAPTVGTDGFAITLSGVIHVPVGATGYDVAPWTNYTVVYDL